MVERDIPDYQQEEMLVPHPLHSSDYELIEAAKAGNSEAFGVLFERYYPVLVRYTTSRISSAEDAEDMVQDAFLVLLERLGQYEDRGFPLSSFLYRIVHHKVIDQSRSAAHKRMVPVSEMQGSVEDTTERSETIITMADYIELTFQELPQNEGDYRLLYILKYELDLELAVIARKMGKAIGSVKAMDHRFRMRLSRILAQHDAENLLQI